MLDKNEMFTFSEAEAEGQNLLICLCGPLELKCLSEVAIHHC